MMPKIKTEFDFEKEWGVSPLTVEPTSPELGMHRPQERQLMRPWLWDRLEQQDVPGMFWVDKEKLQFRIPWKHGSRQGWEQNKDAVLFQMWAEHTGKFRRTDERSVRDPKTWKATFRCALNSLPDVKEVPDMSEKRGPNAYRVYQFLEPKRSRKIRKSTEGATVVKKTTRKINCYNKEFASMPSPSLKRTHADFDDFGFSDDNDDGMSDTTDSGSEDFSYRPIKKIKTEVLEEKTVENLRPAFEDQAITNNEPSFCTCGTDNHQHLPTQENNSTKESGPSSGNYSKERNRQILQFYLKSRDVRKALAQGLSEQRRLALLHQKFLATKQWVQTTQQTTTFTAYPRSNFEDDITPIPSHEDDVTSTTSSGNRTSIVSELAQKCLEERMNSSPLPNVETLTRKNRVATCPKLTIPNIPSLRNADVMKDTTPPLTPTNTGAADHVSSSSDPVSPARNLPSGNAYSPTVSPRAHLFGSPKAKLQPPVKFPSSPYQPTSPIRPSPNYHAVTAAKENQVVLTPPSSTDSRPSKDADRDTASPYSDLSDESVISMVDDMMTMTTTTVQTTVTAAPVDYIVQHHPVETPSFCQLFSSSSQLLLANGYSQA